MKDLKWFGETKKNKVTNGWMDGRTNGRTNGQTNGRMNEVT